jgi:phage-related protein
VERKIVAYGNYFDKFYKEQSSKVRDKIDYVLDIVKYIDQVPTKFLKHLSGTDGLYEVRVSIVFKEVRIFCFFDQGNLVILTNCFIKKTQKTPRKEFKLAIRLRNEYFKDKNNGK